MRTKDVQNLFGLRNWRGKVVDYYVGSHDTYSSKRAEKDLMYNFGFNAKDGDTVCAILIRPTRKRKR